MKEIGGYFPLELNIKKEYYPNALKLNSGRNALWYIIKTHSIQKIYIPYYCCESVIEPIQKTKIKYEFYRIDENFKPIFNVDLKQKEFILYINYFGINDNNVKFLFDKIENLIIDNSQAFYSHPIKYPTFYSPRKFFGVPDGAYLFTNKFLKEELQQATSYEKCSFLLKRLDLDSQSGYDEYKTIEDSFSNEPPKKMSKLTEKILSSIDYLNIKQIREKNFQHLHEKLKKINLLNIDFKSLNGPYKYPLLIKNENLKEYLIEEKIYISTYWLNVLKWAEKENFEYNLTKNLISIPMDQRYNENDMNLIIEKIINFIH